MSTIASQLETAFRTAIRAAFGIDADPLIGPSQNEKFGDYQSNAAMGLAKILAEKTGQKTNPRAVAEQIKAKLELGDTTSEVSIAGPGFINVRLSPQWLGQRLETIASDQRLGIATSARPQRVVVDYSAPNIAKEMHVGHLRSTIIGDAVVRVLTFHGDTVIRQNHIGDWGTQFGKVILAIWHICMAESRGDPEYPVRIGAQLAEAEKQKDADRRARIIREIAQRHQEDLDNDPEGATKFAPFLERFEPVLQRLEPVYQFVTRVEAAPEAERIYITHRNHGRRTLASLSKLITSLLQKKSEQEYRAWRKVRKTTMDACQQVYDRLGVLLTHADEKGESSYDPMLPGVVADLKKMGLASESDGAIVVFIDGPEKPPLIIEKSGGEGYLYGTTDLAAIRYRVGELRAERIVYMVDARQSQHFNQVFATARKAGWAPTEAVSLEHAAFGTMLGEDGRPFKTRSGDTVKLKELLDEAEERALRVVSEKNPELPELQRRDIAHSVGIGAVKYADLSKDRISDYVFSWDKMLSLEGNTAPYLQYAYARIRSIFRRAAERGITKTDVPIRLESPHELALAKHILRLGEVIDQIARDLKPHLICTYVYELATRFSGFFENCPVLQSEEPVRSSRLSLCELTARTLALGLDLLGIEHPEQM